MRNDPRRDITKVIEFGITELRGLSADKITQAFLTGGASEGMTMQAALRGFLVGLLELFPVQAQSFELELLNQGVRVLHWRAKTPDNKPIEGEILFS